MLEVAVVALKAVVSPFTETSNFVPNPLLVWSQARNVTLAIVPLAPSGTNRSRSLDLRSRALVGSVGPTSALLLRSSDRLRFVPDGANGTIASVTFRAWDQTSNGFGTKFDVSVNGDTTAFSATTATSNITVASVNDAPRITDGATVILTGQNYRRSVGNPRGVVDAGNGNVGGGGRRAEGRCVAIYRDIELRSESVAGLVPGAERDAGDRAIGPIRNEPQPVAGPEEQGAGRTYRSHQRPAPQVQRPAAVRSG